MKCFWAFIVYQGLCLDTWDKKTAEWSFFPHYIYQPLGISWLVGRSVANRVSETPLLDGMVVGSRRKGSVGVLMVQSSQPVHRDGGRMGQGSGERESRGGSLRGWLILCNIILRKPEVIKATHSQAIITVVCLDRLAIWLRNVRGTCKSTSVRPNSTTLRQPLKLLSLIWASCYIDVIPAPGRLRLEDCRKFLRLVRAP